jgi:16S rRNA (guanine527-N7)-methyltransferase
VGSGAGFPGLPLKILYPDLELTLVESIGKKAGFLKAVTAALGLNDVLVQGERAELLGHMDAHRGRYDWAVARAVASLSVLAEYLLPFCRVGGRVIAMKGKRAAEEIDSALAAVEVLGGDQPALHPVQLPGADDTHYLVVINKVAETPLSYPRRPGLPAKHPLK